MDVPALSDASLIEKTYECNLPNGQPGNRELKDIAEERETTDDLPVTNDVIATKTEKGVKITDRIVGDGLIRLAIYINSFGLILHFLMYFLLFDRTIYYNLVSLTISVLLEISAFGLAVILLYIFIKLPAQPPQFSSRSDSHVESISIQPSWTFLLIFIGIYSHYIVLLDEFLGITEIFILISTISGLLLIWRAQNNPIRYRSEISRYYISMLRAIPLAAFLLALLVTKLVIHPLQKVSVMSSETPILTASLILTLIIGICWTYWYLLKIWVDAVTNIRTHLIASQPQPIESTTLRWYVFSLHIIYVFSLFIATGLAIASLLSYVTGQSIVRDSSIVSVIVAVETLLSHSSLPTDIGVGLLLIVFCLPLVLFVSMWVYGVVTSFRYRRMLFGKAERVPSNELPFRPAVPVYAIDNDIPVLATTMVEWRRLTSRILIREDLLTLEAEEIEAIYRHEEYHVKNRHRWNPHILKLCDLFGGWFAILPLVYPASAEHEADKYATEHVGSEAVCTALKKVVLIKRSSHEEEKSELTSHFPKALHRYSLFHTFVTLNWAAFAAMSYRHFSYSLRTRIQLLE